MTTPPLSRSHLSIGDIDCAYADFGSADVAQPVILALHGWGASADLIAPLAARLAMKGFRIIAPDLPGFGESTPPPQTWSVYDYADHVLRFMDALKLDHVHLFGHSFGGRLSLILGAQHPQRVISIALSNSAGVPPRKDPIVQARTSLYKGVRDGLKAVGLTTLSDRLRDAYVARYASADYKNAGVLRDSFVKIVNENLLPLASQVKAPALLITAALFHQAVFFHPPLLGEAALFLVGAPGHLGLVVAPLGQAGLGLPLGAAAGLIGLLTAALLHRAALFVPPMHLHPALFLVAQLVLVAQVGLGRPARLHIGEPLLVPLFGIGVALHPGVLADRGLGLVGVAIGLGVPVGLGLAIVGLGRGGGHRSGLHRGRHRRADRGAVGRRADGRGGRHRGGRRRGRGGGGGVLLGLVPHLRAGSLVAGGEGQEGREGDDGA